MNAEATQIVCPHCAATNRVPRDKPAVRGKCGRCHQPLFAGKPVAATAATFDQQIQHSDIPVLVDFWAAWCGPCRAMAPVYERAAAEFEPHVRFLKLDTEAEGGLAARYHIQAIPILMLFHKGAVLAQRAGAIDGETLRAWLRQYVALPSAASTAG